MGFMPLNPIQLTDCSKFNFEIMKAIQLSPFWKNPIQIFYNKNEKMRIFLKNSLCGHIYKWTAFIKIIIKKIGSLERRWLPLFSNSDFRYLIVEFLLLNKTKNTIVRDRWLNSPRLNYKRSFYTKYTYLILF